VTFYYGLRLVLLARQPHATPRPPIPGAACGGPAIVVGFALAERPFNTRELPHACSAGQVVAVAGLILGIAGRPFEASA